MKLGVFGMFVLSHLFSNRMEVAYRESLALKRQEELLREEEQDKQVRRNKHAVAVTDVDCRARDT